MTEICFYRLLLQVDKLKGKMCNAIRSLYTDSKCSININGFLTDVANVTQQYVDNTY